MAATEAPTREEIDAAHAQLDGNGASAAPAAPPDEILVRGTTQLGLFEAGGKKPVSSSLRLSGGRVLLVDGQAYRKGDRIRFEGTAVVEEVAQRDKTDSKTQIVVACEQKHVARITDLVVHEADG